ncbi:Extended synaptotagmin-1 [Triplophysa tibetana]|uniref:Extended synaptotagmin-1 n=1 Tax=Triplophysa tibetana TaxID=1572043 RepID=A0A5A9ND28_9TELE|nr:Extended synaptotagmin-1 [Triplophysa tibetana]
MAKESLPSGDAGLRTGAASEVADSALAEDGQPLDSPGKQAVSVLWSFFKCLGALLVIYLAGYFGFSLSLVLLCLVVYTGWKHSRDGKKARLQRAMSFLENEEDVTTTRAFRSKREIPAWVNFPDVEKVDWINKILQQAWPFIGQYLEKLLVETIAPSIRSASAHLQTLSFTKVDLGDRAIEVAGVKAYTEHDKRQVILDLYISYAGDVEINVEVKRYFCKAGVKGIQLHGKLRVILEPLIGDIPLVGAVTMFFIRRPKLDINWTGMTNLLDIPGLNVMSDTMIMDAIASFLVLPNRLTVPLVANLHVAQLRSPLPRGIVRIHLLEAENLASKDNYVKGVISGKSDPYAVLRVGTQTFTSHHVDNNLNPQWREMYEVIVHEVPGQELELEVFDKDPDKDDFLGRMKLDLGIVKKAVVLDEWYTLKDATSGQVHLRLEWLSLLPSADRLTEVLQMNQKITVVGKTADLPSAAILTVYLDRAQDLPFRKGNKDPSPVVQISVQKTTKESRTAHGTNNPVWEEAFTFFIKDPREQDIDIQVKDDDRTVTLGNLTIPFSRLLSCPELSMDQWFQLDSSGPASRIYVTALLRVLWLNEEAIPTSPVSPLPGEGDIESKVSPGTIVPPTLKRPDQTSPDSGFASEGVLRIHLVEAENLIAKDNLMGGMMKGKSDPYVKIRVGGVAFKSQVVKENLNPIWNELYEVILTQLPGQDVEFDLYDKDIDQDDFLGRVKMSLKDLISSQFTDQWYNLNDVKSGRLHLVMEWVPKVSDPTRLDKIMQYNSLQSYQNEIVPSVALLFLYIERAHGLPLKKSGKEPKAGAELSIKNVSYRTKIANSSTSPQWDEAFHFLIHNPKEDILVVKLSHSWGQPLGALVLPVRELLDEKDLVLDHWFTLDGAMPESEILLRAELKVLDSKLAQCSDSPTTAEEATDIIPSGDAASETNRELRHRNLPGTEDAAVSRKSQVKLSVAYSSDENRLVINVHACRNLPSFSKDPPDTYISFILLPDKNRTTKKKTNVKKRNLNPEINERFDFEMSLDEAKHRCIELSVKNSVSFMSREKERIGRLQIDLKQLDLKAGLTQWYDLSNEIN